MAIVIEDNHTVELIRKIGERTGETPSVVVRRLAEREAAAANALARPDADAAFRRLQAITRSYGYKGPPLSPEETRKMQDELFDDLENGDAGRG